MGSRERLIPKFFYGAVFVVLVPVLLLLWARGTATAIALPALQNRAGGGGCFVVGLALVLTGMFELWRVGGGLPMNAFPPPRFVANGVYAAVPHPIYGGFVMLCVGVSLWYGSASGLWLVSPAVALYCAALVLGYEMPDLHARFGVRAESLWLPNGDAGYGGVVARLRIYLVILLPWLVLFEAIGAMGKPPGALSTYLSFEQNLPVLAPLEVVYFSTYVVVLLAPLAIPASASLRRFALQGLRAMAVIFPLYLLLPVYVPPRPFAEPTVLAPLLQFERTPISGIGAFPSFHVVWALIAASALGDGGQVRRWLWSLWAVAVCVSCVATGMHSIADVAAGLLMYSVVARLDALWSAMLRGAETLANSWKEWRLGPLRVINHGAYAGLGAFVGACMIDMSLGPGHSAITAEIFVLSTVGAALWAQWVEGSPALLRPMGFYGGMVGGILAALLAPLQGVPLWKVFAALALATPWIQALGRLRCLVQGCCHGHATKGVQGICYRHPRTRVYRLAHLAGVPIHATPVYSILCNVAVGLGLLRLLELRVASSVLCGVYLLLTSAGRFVEEAYRGEPQTKIVLGLRLYQWIAVVTAVVGAVLTCLPSAPVQAFSPLRAGTVVLALLCGLGAWFATGMDFPESSRRFARLT